MSWTRSKVWKRIEDAMTGRLAPRDRSALFEELQRAPQARADYDLAFEALRELEQAPVAEAEIDLVESWLMQDLEAETEAAVAWWRRPWTAAVLAFAAAAILAVVLRPTGPEVDDDGFQARGTHEDRPLAIDALCPQKPGARDGLVPAAEYGCALDGTLSFAYRVDPSVSGGTLTLFGVDAAGDVLYYAPTPDDPAGIDASPGTWTPLPMVVQLGVNHEPGAVVVYGLVSPHVPTMAQVDAMAAVLAPARLLSDAPWHQRFFDDPTVAALCPDDSACESAELTFTIHEALR